MVFVRVETRGGLRLPGIWWDPARLLKEFPRGDWTSVRSYCCAPPCKRVHLVGIVEKGVEGRGEFSNSFVD